jgi:hypothetical protein
MELSLPSSMLLNLLMLGFDRDWLDDVWIDARNLGDRVGDVRFVIEGGLGVLVGVVDGFGGGWSGLGSRFVARNGTRSGCRFGLSSLYLNGVLFLCDRRRSRGYWSGLER